MLFTFPSRYWFTIGRQDVFSLRRWSSQIPTGFHVSRSTWVFNPGRPGTFHLKDYHLLWSRFPADSVKHRFGNFPSLPEKAPIKPHDPDHATLSGLSRMIGLGCFPFARRYLENRFCFLLLRVLRCFSSPRSPPGPMNSVQDVTGLTVTGFPIQKSPDQSLLGSSPRLIAACRVFHRRLAPRHPPSALCSLATKLS